MLDIKTLESWLWDGACSIRGAVDAPKFKDYILPLIFVKRISDVFEDELKRLSDEFGDEKVAYDLARKDHKLVRFFIPRSSTWPEIRKKTKNIGVELTDAIRAIAKKNSSVNPDAVPAKAGNYSKEWIPASIGMTRTCVIHYSCVTNQLRKQ